MSNPVEGIEISGAEVMRSITVRFTLTGMNMLQWRIVTAIAIWRLGAIVAGCNVEIECADTGEAVKP